MPRERRQLRVGMGSVKERPGAGDAGCSDRHRTAAGSARPIVARNLALNVHISIRLPL